MNGWQQIRVIATWSWMRQVNRRLANRCPGNCTSIDGPTISYMLTMNDRGAVSQYNDSSKHVWTVSSSLLTISTISINHIFSQSLISIATIIILHYWPVVIIIMNQIWLIKFTPTTDNKNFCHDDMYSGWPVCRHSRDVPNWTSAKETANTWLMVALSMVVNGGQRWLMVNNMVLRCA